MQLPTCECTEVQCTVQRVQPDRGHHCGRRRNDANLIGVTTVEEGATIGTTALV
jgi:hypothetical protein